MMVSFTSTYVIFAGSSNCVLYIDENDDDIVGTDLQQPASSATRSTRHIPLPPPPSQSQEQTPVRRGPRLKSMGGRRGGGPIAAATALNQRQNQVVSPSSSTKSGGIENPGFRIQLPPPPPSTPLATPAIRRRGNTAVKPGPLSLVHVLSDDD